ncbi:MAG: DsbA family protein, partial [Candidatus Bipolaricaulota bacterium]|nr:DsbA family protein [Candidatus Bipolaricaulota bacterium]
MRDLWLWLVVLAAAAAGFFAAYLWFQLKPAPSSETTKPVAPPPASPAFLEEPVKGAPDAPVTIVEFADFKCGFCVRHFTRTLPLIVTEYINTGKVRYIYRNFAFLGVESRWAAEASECAHEQGRF